MPDQSGVDNRDLGGIYPSLKAIEYPCSLGPYRSEGGENWFLGEGKINLTLFNEKSTDIHIVCKQINSICVVCKYHG